MSIETILLIILFIKFAELIVFVIFVTNYLRSTVYKNVLTLLEKFGSINEDTL